MRGISFALLVAGLNADTRGPESEIVFKLSTSDIDDTAVAANLARISGLGVPEVRELRAVLRVRRNRSSPHFVLLRTLLLTPFPCPVRLAAGLPPSRPL